MSVSNNNLKRFAYVIIVCSRPTLFTKYDFLSGLSVNIASSFNCTSSKNWLLFSDHGCNSYNNVKSCYVILQSNRIA